jgi:hypothetical protein
LKPAFGDPVLGRLMGNVEQTQSELAAYLSSGTVPARATPILDGDLVPLGQAQQLVPQWSKSTLRRVVRKHRLGVMIGMRQHVYLGKLRAHIKACG